MTGQYPQQLHSRTDEFGRHALRLYAVQPPTANPGRASCAIKDGKEVIDPR